MEKESCHDDLDVRKTPVRESFLQTLLARTTFWNPAGVMMIGVVLVGLLVALMFRLWVMFF